jgi:hypothetical protein
MGLAERTGTHLAVVVDDFLLRQQRHQPGHRAAGWRIAGDRKLLQVQHPVMEGHKDRSAARRLALRGVQEARVDQLVIVPQRSQRLEPQ